MRRSVGRAGDEDRRECALGGSLIFREALEPASEPDAFAFVATPKEETVEFELPEVLPGERPVFSGLLA